MSHILTPSDPATFQQFVENAPIMVLQMDDEGRFVYANRTALDRMEYKLEALCQLRIYDIVPQSEIAVLTGHFEELRKVGHRVVETVLLTKAGEAFDVEIKDNAVLDDADRFVCTRSFVCEVTNRRQLKSRLNLFTYAFQHSTDGKVITDLQGRIIEMNQAFTDLFGWERHEVLGKTTSFLRAPGTPDDYYREMWETITRVGSWMGEILNRRKDGSVIPILLSITPLYEGDKLIGYLGTDIDITEKKKAEEELRREKEFSEALIETASTLIVGLNLDGNIILFNRRCEEVTGYQKSEVMGKSWFDTFLSERQRQDVGEIFESLVSGEFPSRYENPIITRDGAERMISWNNTPIWDESHRVIGVVGIGLDVTEQQSLQRTVLQTERLATIGKMGAKVAHEIRNPLSSISLNAELLQDEVVALEGDRSESQNLLKAIISEVDRLALLTEEYLQFSRLPMARPVDTDLNTLVCETLQFVNPELSTSDVELRLDLDESIPEVTLDPAQMRRALINLIRNALEAMPRGGDLTIRTMAKDKKIVVAIKDTGEGISDDELGSVFDPFFSTKEFGTGLGLTLTRQIVEEHDGQITFESREGRGTTFCITLPLKENGT